MFCFVLHTPLYGYQLCFLNICFSVWILLWFLLKFLLSENKFDSLELTLRKMPKFHLFSQVSQVGGNAHFGRNTIWAFPQNFQHKKLSEISIFCAVLLALHLEQSYKCTSSHRRCSVRKGVVGNFTKFTGKHLSQSLAG